MTDNLLNSRNSPPPLAEFAQDRIGRSILSPRLVANPSSGFTGLALLAEVERFLLLEKSIKDIARGVAHQSRIAAIKSQLAPGQRVVFFETRQEEGQSTIEIVRELPGRGYITDPQKTTLTRVHKASELCYLPGREPRETDLFSVDGRSISLDAAEPGDVDSRNDNSDHLN